MSSSSRLCLQVWDIQVRNELPPRRGAAPQPSHQEVWDLMVTGPVRADCAVIAAAPKEKPPGRRPFFVTSSVVVVFGCTEQGESVCLRLTGAQSHLWVQMPAEWGEKEGFELAQELADALHQRDPLDCQVLQKANLAGWEPDLNDRTQRRQHLFLKICFPSMGLRARAFNLLTGRKGQQLGSGLYPKTYGMDQTLQSQFLLQHDLKMGGWLELAGQPRSVGWSEPGRCSGCGLEVITEARNVRPLPHRTDIAPVLIASVDGEMYSASRKFPNFADPQDAVIGIGVVLQRYDQRDPAAWERHYFALGEVAPTPDFHLHCFSTEEELLLGYRDFLVKRDPTIVVGYNIFQFDWQYFAKRVKDPDTSRFLHQGRFLGEHHPLKTQRFESGAHGQNVMELLPMPGRVQIDLCRVVKQGWKLRAYSLSAVSQHFVGHDKVDMTPHQLFDAYESGGPMGRLDIATYCVQDCVLPLELVQHLSLIPNLIEDARLNYTSPEEVLSRGMGIKTQNLIFAFCHRDGIVAQAFPPGSIPEASSYEGAFVLEPERGFFSDPVLTLDFKSLYPSIMLQHNLSYDTYVPHPTPQEKTSPALWHIEHDDGSVDHFVKEPQGILPKMLQELLGARAVAKKAMKKETDPLKKAILNARQLALKVGCNSIYGFTGTPRPTGKMPCLPVARSVTRTGRRMILETKAIVTEKGVTRVIYGDTDSVMVLFPGFTRAQAWARGEVMAKRVTEHFGRFVELELEACYMPYLQLQKKRYATIKYESADGPGKRSVSGLELVRRDTILFVQRVYSDVLDKLLACDREGAQRVLHDHLVALEDGKVPLEDLAISCKLKAEYKNPNVAQRVVALKMKARAPGSEPKPGDRMTYVVMPATRRDQPVYERVEDPAFVVKNSLVPDRLYALENQLEKPLTELFSLFLHDPSRLFDATRRALRGQQAAMHNRHAATLFGGGAMANGNGKRRRCREPLILTEKPRVAKKQRSIFDLMTRKT